MSRLAIRCDPVTAVAAEEGEGWLEQEVERLRLGTPRGSFRLHRVSGMDSTAEAGRGWLIELDAACDRDPARRDRLNASLRDMRLLGLRPTLLAAPENGEPPSNALGSTRPEN